MVQQNYSTHKIGQKHIFWKVSQAEVLCSFVNEAEEVVKVLGVGVELAFAFLTVFLKTDHVFGASSLEPTYSILAGASLVFEKTTKAIHVKVFVGNIWVVITMFWFHCFERHYFPITA